MFSELGTVNLNIITKLLLIRKACHKFYMLAAGFTHWWCCSHRCMSKTLFQVSEVLKACVQGSR